LVNWIARRNDTAHGFVDAIKHTIFGCWDGSGTSGADASVRTGGVDLGRVCAHVVRFDLWSRSQDRVRSGGPERKLAAGEKAAIRTELGTICYVEHGLPMMLFLAAHEGYDLRKALLLNVNAGGDNVNRGMPLGMLMGAAAGEVPQDLRDGLTDADELADEIAGFAAIAVSGQGNTHGFVAPSRRGKAVTL